MGAGEWIILAFLAAIVAAVFLARRNGRKALQAALSTARAAGYADAEAAAAARADARATGGSVVIHGGGDLAGLRSTAVDEASDEYSALATGIVRAELRRMDALQRRRFLDEIGVGSLFPGVLDGQDAGDGDRAPVRYDGLHGRRVPRSDLPALEPHAGQG